MSPKKTKTEIEEDAVKKKVNKMYENYGIDPTSSDDNDLSRVYRHYKDNPKQLDMDYNKSKKHADSFSDEDTL